MCAGISKRLGGSRVGEGLGVCSCSGRGDGGHLGPHSKRLCGKALAADCLGHQEGLEGCVRTGGLSHKAALWVGSGSSSGRQGGRVAAW